jgi:hypothetical protein
MARGSTNPFRQPSAATQSWVRPQPSPGGTADSDLVAEMLRLSDLREAARGWVPLDLAREHREVEMAHRAVLLRPGPDLGAHASWTAPTTRPCGTGVPADAGCADNPGLPPAGLSPPAPLAAPLAHRESTLRRSKKIRDRAKRERLHHGSGLMARGSTNPFRQLGIGDPTMGSIPENQENQQPEPARQVAQPSGGEGNSVV